MCYEVGLVHGASLRLGRKNPSKIYISLGSESKLLEHLSGQMKLERSRLMIRTYLLERAPPP